MQRSSGIYLNVAHCIGLPQISGTTCIQKCLSQLSNLILVCVHELPKVFWYQSDDPVPSLFAAYVHLFTIQRLEVPNSLFFFTHSQNVTKKKIVFKPTEQNEMTLVHALLHILWAISYMAKNVELWLFRHSFASVGKQVHCKNVQLIRMFFLFVHWFNIWTEQSCMMRIIERFSVVRIQSVLCCIHIPVH